MQKMEHVLWRGIVTVITAAAMFVLMYRYASAEEIAGEEVYFTHSHTAGCKTVESVSCSRSHSFWLHRSELGTYHCYGCDAQTPHKVETDVHRCADTGNTWQENSYTQCSICGTIHSRWGADPGPHFYNRETIKCGISEGESTLGIRIVADGAWTNQGVTLAAKQTVLKNDVSGGVTFSWDGGSLFVTENGTYTVSAINAAGASVTASIQISCIDKTAPVILSVTGDTQSMTASGISVSVAASDGESGLSDTPYSFDGGITWTSASSVWVENGREIALRVRDKAGNISDKAVRRSDFPYPPPAPMPSPAPTQTTAQQPSDTNPDGETNAADLQSSGGRGEAGSGGTLSESSGISGGSKNTGDGKAEGGKSEEGRTGSGKTQQGAGGTSDSGKQIKPQPAVLKEDTEGNSAGGGFRVVRMDKAQAAGMAGAGTLEGSTEVMAAYMQAVTTGTWNRQNGLQTGAENDSQGGAQNNPANGAQAGQEAVGARYALAGSLSTGESREKAGMKKIVSRLKANVWLAAGALLLGAGVLWGAYMFWLFRVDLYCYDSGNEYRRLGFLHIRKRKKELELYLPDYILTRTGAPRYRLVVKNRLVKRFGKMDLVVHSDDHRLCRPLEECVDFVL